MKFEVENKYAVDDVARIEGRLAEAQATIGPAMEQCDVYFAHPARDFAATDEALRIRTVGDQSWTTYKGPKVDRETKTRREIELPLGQGPEDAARFAELLAELSFRRVIEVRKSRREARFSWGGREVIAALDEVDLLGGFVEIEIVAEEGDLPAAQQAILEIAAAWGLSEPIRRSYLAMLLDSDEPCA